MEYPPSSTCQMMITRWTSPLWIYQEAISHSPWLTCLGLKRNRKISWIWSNWLRCWEKSVTSRMECSVAEEQAVLWCLICRRRDLSLSSTLRGAPMTTDSTTSTWIPRCTARTRDLSPWTCRSYSRGLMITFTTNHRLRMHLKCPMRIRKSLTSNSSTRSSIDTINHMITPPSSRNVSPSIILSI